MEDRLPKRRREEAAMEDRISRLPQHILENHIISLHIISLLPQNEAVRICILSKSWRHFGPIGPKIEFDESPIYRVSKDKFVSAVEKTLQRYVDQKLSIHEFVLRIKWSDSGSNNVSYPHLKKWIPIVMMNLGGVKTFKLTAYDFPLPSLVFESEILEELYLTGCNLNDQISNCINVKLHMLKHLELFQVHIEDVTLEKILSSCPLIEHLVLDSCKGLSTVKVNKARNLKHFVCGDLGGKERIEINDDALSLETIRITRCLNWPHMHNNNYFFPALKSLYLWNVHLPTELLNNNLSSNNCPCLEKLELHHCFGFTEFNLTNRSIKRLIIIDPDRPINAVNVDVASILYFQFKSGYLPSTFSFTTTSNEWKSRVEVWLSLKFDSDVLSTWFLKLHEFLKALRQSQISLDISIPYYGDGTYGGISEPVVVEHLCLSGDYSSSSLREFLNCLSRICRPRNVEMPFSNSLCESQLGESWAKSVWKKICESRLTKMRIM